ncbi:MAG: hypothetical protein LBQ09_10885 [Acidobacteriaceae bacterium]|nr:hypothetical protein [Acidobacteriaceae bacterium]
MNAAAGLNWSWILVMAIAPLPAGLALAYPIWWTRQVILGNLAGSAVIFGVALAFIFREHAELDRLTRACLDAGMTCWPEPSAFMRFAIYAAIAMVQVFVLFSVSLAVESRVRNRAYAPEWR